MLENQQDFVEILFEGFKYWLICNLIINPKLSYTKHSAVNFSPFGKCQIPPTSFPNAPAMKNYPSRKWKLLSQKSISYFYSLWTKFFLCNERFCLLLLFRAWKFLSRLLLLQLFVLHWNNSSELFRFPAKKAMVSFGFASFHDDFFNKK